MKAFKGFMLYVGIVLAIALGLFVFVFGCMYFIPSIKIFGYGVLHENKIIVDTIDIGGYGTKNIEISAGEFDLNVYRTNEDNIEYRLYNNIFGITNDYTLPSVSTKDVGGKYIIQVLYPSGWLNYRDSAIDVFLPNNIYSLFLKTENADIKIHRTLNSLGNLNELNVANLDLITNSGNICVEAYENNINLSNVSIETRGGVCDFTSIDDFVCSSAIEIRGQGGNIKFKNINAPIDLQNTDIGLVFEDLTTAGDLSFITSNLYLNANKIVANELNIQTTSILLKIALLDCASEINTSTGDLFITTANKSTSITNQSGNINIDRAKENILLSNYYGKIVVNSYDKSGTFRNVRGGIKVANTSLQNNNITTTITNADGNVELNNNINKVILDITGNGSAIVKYTDISTNSVEHSLKVKFGELKVYLPQSYTTKKIRIILSGSVSGIFNYQQVSAGIIWYPISANSDTITATYRLTGGVVKLYGI